MYLLYFILESSALNSPIEEAAAKDDEEGAGDDAEGLQANKPDVDHKKKTLAPRWPTRVFAINCLMKIISACDEDKTHFNLVLEKEKNKREKGESI